MPATGEQFEFTHGEQRAVAVEFGGGLREYVAAGQPVLDGFAEDEMCASGRGQLLIPWPNRLRDGRYEWDGRTHQLALTEPKTRTAIHGLVRRAPWKLVDRSDDRVVLEHIIYPRDGYPFTVAARVEYSLAASGLTVHTTLTNIGARACPAGVGAHPYLTVGTETIDSCTLQAPGAVWLPSDEQAIPTGVEPVDGTEYDFRSARPIGETRLDTAFGELQRDSDGRARVVLAAPRSGRSVTLWMDEPYRYLMLFTGDSLPEDRRRRGLAAEPMTCPPNAFVSGDALHRLEPGEAFGGSWGIQPEPQ